MRHYYEEDEPRRYRGESYYGGYYEGPRRVDQERGDWGRRGGRDERGFIDRATDVVRSWFGDEEAERRRRRDEREGTGSWRDRESSAWRDRESGWRGRQSEWSRDPDDRAWAQQWGYVEGSRGERDRTERRYGDRGYTEKGSGSWAERGQADRGWWERGSGDRDWTSSRGTWGEGRSTGQQDRYGSAPWYGGGTSQPERYWGERSAEAGTSGRYPESAWWRGQHVGRGPRSYQRSDERIKDEVCERLSWHGDIDASDVELTVLNGELTLGGRVNNRHEKRLAEDLAETVWGIKEIHNQIRVTQPEGGRTESGHTGESGQSWRTRAA